MRPLPQELLSEIFIACLPHPDEIEELIRHSSSPPLLLCQVCPLWRAIAINTHQLWTHMKILISYSSKLGPTLWASPPKPHEKELARLWGARQGVIPGSITFQGRWTDSIEPTSRANFADLLSLPASLSCRLLALRGLLHRDIEALLNRITKNDFPNLKYLAITFATEGFEDELPPREEPTCSKNLKLHRLHLNTSSLGLDLTRDTRLREAIDWEGLTHLSMDQHITDVVQWHQLIIECSSLSHLAVVLHLDPTPYAKDEDCVWTTHISLKEIIVEVSKGDLSNIFRWLVFPSVTRLRIGAGQMDCVEFTDLREINALLKSTPNLEEFHTQYCFPLGVGEEDTLADFLAGKRLVENDSAQETDEPILPVSSIVPRLHTLVIDRIGYSSEFISFPQCLFQILASPLLLSGWQSPVSGPRRSIIFVADITKPRLVDGAAKFVKVVHETNHPQYALYPEVRLVEEGIWKWVSLEGQSLRYGWKRCSAWIERDVVEQ